jgi:hypothetical protein
MDNWLILQNFYNGLTQSSCDHVDTAAGGAFFSLTIKRATALIEKMVSNQGWSYDRLQLLQRGMHSVKGTDMLAMKIDLPLKKFEDYSQDKAQMQTLQAFETRMTCEICGNVGHSGDNCPKTQEEVLYLNGNNNGFCPQGGQGWNQPRPYYQGGNGNSNYFNPNQPTLRDLVYGQAKINESLQKKLVATEKSIETIHAKMDRLSTAIKNQLSFNKMLENEFQQDA